MHDKKHVNYLNMLYGCRLVLW